jgi:hypothetical protein
VIVTAASGPPRQRGEIIGRAHRDAIGRLVALRTTPSAAIGPYAECVRRQLPWIAEEVTGLAAGSGITADDAWWLQLRRELNPYPAADCSTAAFAQAGLVGQTVDLPPELGQGLHVLDLRPDTGPDTDTTPDTDEPAALVVTFAGLLGYLGVNSAGLAVAINMVQSADWGVGVPPYLLVRAVLRCRGLDEAVEVLRRTPRASSRCLTLLAGHDAVVVEMTATDLRTSTASVIAMTNHFTHPDLVPSDASDATTRMESRLRRRRLRTRLDSAAPTLDGLRETLSDPAFQVGAADLEAFRPQASRAPQGEPGPLATVATVLLEPRRGAIHLRPRGERWQTVTGGWVA